MLRRRGGLYFLLPRHELKYLVSGLHSRRSFIVVVFVLLLHGRVVVKILIEINQG